MTPSADIIRAKLNAGVLPVEQPTILWVGHGSGQTCAVCEQPIVKAQALYEAEYGYRPAIRCHADCYRLWRAAARERGSSADPRS
jgi:hypothetical protein